MSPASQPSDHQGPSFDQAETGERFRAAVNRLLALRGRGAQAGLARDTGLSASYLNDMLRGRKDGSEGARRAVAHCAGLRYDALLEAGRIILGSGDHVAADHLLEPGGETPVDTDGGDEFALVAKVRARVSAGGGSLEVDDSVESYYAFRRDWLSSKGPVSSMRLLHVSGNSMEPELCDGDLIMVDLAQDQIRSGKIYAVRIEDEIVVKIVVTTPGALVLKSANTAQYADIRVPLNEGANVEVIGRVVWSARDY